MCYVHSQDPAGTGGRPSEVPSRHRVSAVLQRLLLLLRSARCCRPAAQWYISQLRRARHLQYKVTPPPPFRAGAVWCCVDCGNIVNPTTLTEMDLC